MIALCEKCFPGWGAVEVKTIVPLSPCARCGVWDNRFKGGPRVHLLAREPKENERATAS